MISGCDALVLVDGFCKLQKMPLHTYNEMEEILMDPDVYKLRGDNSATLSTALVAEINMLQKLKLEN